MFNVKRWIGMMLPLLILFLLVGAFGCGAPSEEEVVDEEVTEEEEVVDEEEPAAEEEEEEEPPVSVEEWENPTELVDVLDRFKELEWTWTKLENGQKTDSKNITFRNEGPESVAGEEADLLVFTENEDEFRIWVDENGNAVQAEFGGEVIPGQFVQEPLNAALKGFFLPFWTVEEMGIREFAQGYSQPGYNLRDVSTERKDFGDVSAEVTRLEVYLEPPLTQEGKEGTVIWGIGDFDGEFQMLVEWDWGEEYAKRDDIMITYELNKVVPQ